MKKINRVVLLLAVVLSCKAAKGQRVGMDTIGFQQKMAQAAKLLQDNEAPFMKKLEDADKKDPNVFKNKDGSRSITKVILKIVEYSMPLRKQMYDDWATLYLNKDEYAYYKTLQFNLGQSAGVPVLSIKNIISYDEKWLSDVWLTMRLNLKPDFNLEERIYYNTAYDITGIVEPPYMAKVVNERDLKLYVYYSIYSMVFEYFIIMHEFYHSYYENRLHITKHDEIAADNYALLKWTKFSAGFGYDKVMMDKEFMSDGQFLGFGEQLKSLISDAECGGANFFNEGVTQGEFMSAFLGVNVISLFFISDARFFLTKKDQIQMDVKRWENFINLAYAGLKCKPGDKTTFCCSLAGQQKRLGFVKEICERVKPVMIDQMACDTGAYRKIFPGEPAEVAFETGNFYAGNKQYAKAIQYYSSTNQFKEKYDYVVLCNLMCYEIYHNIPLMKDAVRAGEYLQKAKAMNARTTTIRNEVINSLE
jgi:hypothetical protein